MRTRPSISVFLLLSVFLPSLVSFLFFNRRQAQKEGGFIRIQTGHSVNRDLDSTRRCAPSASVTFPPRSPKTLFTIISSASISQAQHGNLPHRG
ncbi:hypothetical protein IWZ01DRAFT_323719 [Phyllosticta capitalensis]